MYQCGEASFMFGVNMFGYTGFTPPTIGMRAEWADYPVSAPTLYQHCLDDPEERFPGWTYTIPEGETHLDMLEDVSRNDDASAIQVPEGWTVTLYKHGVDGSGGDKHELVGPTNVVCFTSIGLNDAVTTIVAVNTGGGGSDCSDTHQETKDDGTCGACEEGYVLDEDEASDTYNQCIEEDNLLLYAGIGVVVIIVGIALFK
jgi:hypothetical protein